jgi:hypothetical protein
LDAGLKSLFIRSQDVQWPILKNFKETSMKFGIFFCMIVLLTFLVPGMAFSESQSIKLSAETGSFNVKTLGSASASVNLSADMKLLGFRGSRAWPASAYIGVFEGNDRNNSLQILTIRNRPEDPYLVVGYRLVLEGRETVVKSLEDVSVSSVVKLSMSFQNGLAKVRVNDQPPVLISTPLRSVSPYVSVASGDAEFAVVQ